MPRFLKRIFPEHLFRKEGNAHVNHDHLQRSRRVLVRPSSTNPVLYENTASNWRLGVFYEADQGASTAEERRALRDGASLAESSEHQYYQQERHQRTGEEEVGRKAERVRRRLSKRHRMPG